MDLIKKNPQKLNLTEYTILLLIWQKLRHVFVSEKIQV